VAVGNGGDDGLNVLAAETTCRSARRHGRPPLLFSSGETRPTCKEALAEKKKYENEGIKSKKRIGKFVDQFFL
jgi:hypothetical protein